MKSEGACSHCKKVFSGAAMTKHLQSCPERNEQNKKEENGGAVYLMTARCNPFWVYFEVNAHSTLRDIDDFLRNLWLECCGHLSLFKIDNANYASNPQREYGDKSMEVHLDKALQVGTVFIHEYDFGTTTTLSLKVISERKGSVEKVSVVAKNNLPDFACRCGKPVKKICGECVWENKGFLCQTCAKKHTCGEDMLLPYVNSPRAGMCGYIG